MGRQFLVYWISWIAADSISHLVAGPFATILDAQSKIREQGWKSIRYQVVGQRIEVFRLED